MYPSSLLVIVISYHAKGDYSNQQLTYSYCSTLLKCTKHKFLFIRVYVASREDFNLYHAPAGVGGGGGGGYLG